MSPHSDIRLLVVRVALADTMLIGATLQNLAYCAENISLDKEKMKATLGVFPDKNRGWCCPNKVWERNRSWNVGVCGQRTST